MFSSIVGCLTISVLASLGIASIVSSFDDDTRIYASPGGTAISDSFQCTHAALYASTCADTPFSRVRALHSSGHSGGGGHSGHSSGGGHSGEGSGAGHSSSTSHLTTASHLRRVQYGVLSAGIILNVHTLDNVEFSSFQLSQDLHYCGRVTVENNELPATNSTVVWLCDHDEIALMDVFATAIAVVIGIFLIFALFTCIIAHSSGENPALM